MNNSTNVYNGDKSIKTITDICIMLSGRLGRMFLQILSQIKFIYNYRREKLKLNSDNIKVMLVREANRRMFAAQTRMMATSSLIMDHFQIFSASFWLFTIG